MRSLRSFSPDATERTLLSGLFTGMATRPPASDSSTPEERPDPSPRVDPPSNGVVGSLLESAARAGFSGARGVARRLGIDRAVDRSVDRALDSETAANATERFLDNETTKRVWGKVLESDEAQKLVERVADAPEVRAAIAKQGIGMLDDLRRGVRSAARQIDTASSEWPAGFSAGPSGSAARSMPVPSAGCSRWRSTRASSTALCF